MEKLNCDWIQIDEGVNACRVDSDSALAVYVDCSPRDILWVTCLEGEAECKPDQDTNSTKLHSSDSSMFIWARGPWKLLLQLQEETVVGVFRISLNALHRMLQVDFNGMTERDQRMDFSNLSQIVHFSPLRTRHMGRIFIQPHDSKFRSIARQGIFYDVFAEFLEKLYGRSMDSCPFQIDTDTEKKIRYVHQLVTKDLQNLPDVGALALEADIPRQVVEEGFNFIYGSSIPEYHDRYRFEKARIMLESGKYLIKEIAFELGYQNPSHFISAFKQRFGTTPKQWAKQNVA